MPIAKDFHVKSEADLPAVARDLAGLLAPGTVAALEGDLGAGKTALARAIIRHLAGRPDLDVPSPTFTLVQTYDTPGAEIWHFDLYRLRHPEEIFELGWEDALASGGIVLVEWAQRMGPFLPAGALHVTVTVNDDGTRTIGVRE